MSHDERFKGRDKKTHKMTRDGLMERNAATGEEPDQQRRQDFKLRDRLAEGADGRGPAPIRAPVGGAIATVRAAVSGAIATVEAPVGRAIAAVGGVARAVVPLESGPSRRSGRPQR